MVSDWGSTALERSRPLDGDAFAPAAPTLVHRAIDVDAPTALVFAWLCQLRVAPYSYDLLDNLGRRSPQRRDPVNERLETGQRFMGTFRLVAFTPGRELTLRARAAVFGDVVVTYAVLPRGARASRVLVRLRCAPPLRVLAPVLAAGDLVMMRRQLLNLKALAERDARDEAAATAPPVLSAG